jgi:osmotically-inducible protein OsmY
MANDRDYEFPYGESRDRQDYGRDFGGGRDYSYSSAREYGAAGALGGDRQDRNFRRGGTGYGERDYRPDNWGGRESYGAGNRDYYGGRSDSDRSYGGGSGRGSSYGGGTYGSGRSGGQYRGAYASDGHRFTETGDRDRDRGGWSRDDDRGNGNRGRSYGGQPQGYDYQDRGFFERAGDEVRSWFGDEEAERRREYDQRYDERMGSQSSYGRDSDYHNWRRTQIDALDRDYHEYRQENAKKFENEFGNWRTERQTQRGSLSKVTEHMEVVGSDGEHVGTVDKVRGDRIILTKNDSDAGGRHHSIPSRWIRSVEDKVTITKTASEAQSQWKDEEQSGAMFGNDDATGKASEGTVNLNRSFSGTY